ncbi:acyl carrier protein [Amycolatopsis sp. CA-126428]|uniref:acyl carrier protein n=1 Tax=Amycolatopsis sp. CA-126428 TaxID=2073158 RepID=UPI0018EBD795|nr:phosphopantetheine-binding protein [Amycolatopsis sp. CA-126428]
MPDRACPIGDWKRHRLSANGFVMVVASGLVYRRAMFSLSADEVESRIKRILVEDAYLDLPVDSISASDGLAVDLGLDSLGFTELRVQCERQFATKIPDEQFNSVRFHSVGSVRDLILELCR